MKIINYKYNLSLKIFILLFILIAQSCTTIRLISDYDEITDKAVTSMQDMVSKYFAKLGREIGTEKAKYENYAEYFDDMKVDLNNLKIRANAIENNQIVQNQVLELTNMVVNTEKLHKIGFSSPLELNSLQNSFNNAFTAIVKLQLALKRGEKTTKN